MVSEMLETVHEIDLFDMFPEFSNVVHILAVIPAGGGGGTPKKLGMGVRPASQNPYPIYDQNLRFSLPYL